MSRYIVKRLLMMIPVILGVTWFVFTLMYFTPGDPAQIILGADATEQEIQEKREELGLNGSYLERFGTYLKQVFVDGDLGTSYIYNNSIADEIAARFPNTFKIAAISVVLAVIIGLPLGVMAAVNQNTWKDNGSMFLALFGVSMPSFWFALMMVIVLSLHLKLLPATGLDSWKCYIMPCVSIAIGGAAGIARQTRSSMLEVIRQDYITTARAKGQTEFLVTYKHALRNALIPIITQVGNMLGIQLGGAIVAESIFSVPGLGTYMVSAIKNRDYPVVQGSVLVVAICFGLVMLLVDIVFAFADPRIRSQYQKKKKVAKEA
ncbi:ABC transporter permease [Cuneatibacter sp. NSJ-177]|uniref:ABC transporter permease n=1 Tax=Cuneatibacter sp. NSJ-177 TaxID=2931401 RepID=UPI001FD11892|nr:ABC transporter permease [Cuneatibacter sp. NSJ-177]MCJ7834307.1 ABC transporter permease [Cuneatibacter sp. NSJ-177]